ncbi:MAG: peptidoglycan-binding protein [Silicimonas sp.]|nr:peptidoglycan-binding protein [Silicimonas sp.]
MFRRKTVKYAGVAALTATMATLGAERAQADFHKAVGAAIILCGTGIVNCKQGSKRRTTTTRRSSGMSSAQRQQNKDVQAALNAFNFPVGTVDGSLGPKSRRAIGNYQAYMGWGSTGYLDDYQRQTLVDSHNKLQYGGGAAYPNMMAREGARGLLRTAVNPQYPAQYGDNVGGYGGNTQGGYAQGNQGFNQGTQGFAQTDPNFHANQGNSFGNNGGGQQLQNPNQVFGNNTQQANLGQQGQVIDQGNGGGGVQPLAKLPTLNLKGNEPVSIASRCDLVELTSEATGVIMSSNLTDPNQALSEKFCDARTYSIRNSQYVMSQVSVSENEMTGTCGQIEKAITGQVSGISSQGNVEVLGSVAKVSSALGLDDPATAEIYGQICLGMGYRQDNAKMALAGALILTAAGKAPYSELVGHHIREGFGVPANTGNSKPWYEAAVSALEQGQPPAFEPSTTAERVMIIRKSIEMGGLRAGLAPLPKLVPTANSVILPDN